MGVAPLFEAVLHDFLLANRDVIIARTRAKVANRPAPRATEEELRSGIPLFVDQLIETMDSAPPTVQAMGESATRHGGDLLRRGFTVAQVVHDYGGVCQAVTELADERNASITADEFHTFNRCLDDAIAQAVTEYSRQRERALTEQGTERLGELAHELRNALGVAMLAFQTLRMGTVGLGGSTSALLGRSLERLATLIDPSLVPMRDANIGTPACVSVRAFIDEVQVAAAMEAKGRRMTLSIITVDAEVEVVADRQTLAAAVANLLQNAFKFTRPRGHVTLRASATADRVLLEVEDECGGLTAEAEDLFRPFEQRSGNRIGLGLGLSITRKTVQANGGEIRIRNVPGVGCVVTIDLPRVPPAPQPAAS
jgi:signal transduction histidine kinase